MALESHLANITQTSEAISSLSFAHPATFINSLLASPDIVSLIRDAQPHERGLFSLKKGDEEPKRARKEGAAPPTPLKKAPSVQQEADILLRAAEKLVKIYPMPEASQRIASLEGKYSQLTYSISKLEAIVEEQRARLDILAQTHADYSSSFDDDAPRELAGITEEDLLREEEEIRQLEERMLERRERIKLLDQKLQQSF
ncbi:hypothetical protein G7K_2350-t1 [Saitoella complicata NRRL Y-17804]|uniref:DASH complex subunit SPC34 n=1 Tax=Saitoella complicata (strain BCRC 22490 / CBS 7301 / JCM 7358 / NBRC 10748 / NRRL Y-17804) TaxID=698492 RepID=A0A0E9NFI3_SAICN|nr:hypothetical protein G7K_2350-t1 [Saitoella complicata NRRL Y-17804]